MPEQTFDVLASRQWCEGCSAACCRMVTFPHRRPQTFLDMDYLRYMVGFPNFEIMIDSDGEWMVAVMANCSHFDAATNLCKVYNTSRRPHVCSTFSSDHCWYHRNFVDSAPPELIRLDMERFEVLLKCLTFDDAGNIVHAPTWEQLRAIAGSGGPNRIPGWPAPGAQHRASAAQAAGLQGRIGSGPPGNSPTANERDPFTK